jgi:hypothetical protein
MVGHPLWVVQLADIPAGDSAGAAVIDTWRREWVAATKSVIL